jgi:hypothetical protein
MAEPGDTAFVDSRPTRITRRAGLPGYSPGRSSGSGSARLDLSQKGDLPSSGERIAFVGPRSPTRAKGPIGKGPGCLETRASRVPGAKGVLP